MTDSIEYTTETVSCDICQSDQYETFLTGKDMLHGLPGQWSLVKCSRCGLIFTNPRPGIDSIGLFYPEEYGPHQARPSHRSFLDRPSVRWALHHYWGYPRPERVSLAARLLGGPAMLGVRLKSRNFDLFPWSGEGKLLDYGCGGGGYLARMKQLGWQVCGLDMSQNAVDHCRGQGLEAHQGVDPSQTFEKESFDAVTCWHVIEHVPSPTQTLIQIKAVLKPQGRLIMAMPNIASLTAKWFGACWFALDLPRHLTHFSPTTIEQLLEKTGYVVEKIEGQRHGQITKKSIKYLCREKQSIGYKWLSQSPSICSLLETYCNLIGRPARMVVHARKKNE